MFLKYSSLQNRAAVEIVSTWEKKNNCNLRRECRKVNIFICFLLLVCAAMLAGIVVVEKFYSSDKDSCLEITVSITLMLFVVVMVQLLYYFARNINRFRRDMSILESALK